MFLKNAWYVAAWDHEILADTLLARTLLGVPVLFYRKENGDVVAMDDKCCHRHAPLHLGRKQGDCVRCMYHGVTYGPDGRCVEVPGQAKLPPALKQRTYPVVQKKRWVWIWMGDAERADEAAIPDTFSLDHPEWRWLPNYLQYDCSHMLITDNLLDFSHLDYVHEKTFGGASSIAETQPLIEMLERGIRIRRPVRDTVPAPYHRKLGRFEGNVDRWFTYDFHAPGILLLDAGVKPTGTPDDDLSEALRFHSCQAITPENDRSTHYFFMSAHNFRRDDAVVTETIARSLNAAFAEDKLILEAQQKMIDSTAESPMVAIGADNALYRYRRLMAKLLAEDADESSGAGAFPRAA
jgi:phenylpropionate dioxygenase-like ring-hydroxylating dioxygenase large terminal subunit